MWRFARTRNAASLRKPVASCWERCSCRSFNHRVDGIECIALQPIVHEDQRLLLCRFSRFDPTTMCRQKRSWRQVRPPSLSSVPVQRARRILRRAVSDGQTWRFTPTSIVNVPRCSAFSDYSSRVHRGTGRAPNPAVMYGSPGRSRCSSPSAV